MNDLDFTSSDWDDDPADEDDEGWTPIGDSTLAFTDLGNGNTISNLFINRAAPDNGLFGKIGAGGSVEDLGLVNASVTATGSSGNRVGVLVGDNEGDITAVYATGAVRGVTNVGGLVGKNGGAILTSYAAVSVAGTSGGTVQNTGGLTGFNSGGSVTDSYATGAVTGDNDVGGLVGENNSGTITNSYAAGPVSGSGNGVGGIVGNNTSSGTTTKSYFDSDVSGRSGGIGRTTAQLQTPISNTDPFAAWDTGVWDFGTGSQYPALKVAFDDDDTATWKEFGYQLREGPAPAATIGETNLTLTWDSLDNTLWSDRPSITYDVYCEQGGTVVRSEGVGSPHTDTPDSLEVQYTYRVAARWSAPLMLAITNEAPVITNTETAVEVAENETFVLRVTATDANTSDNIELFTRSGDDMDSFDIVLDRRDGVLSFTAPPDFETPGSAAVTNVYAVSITATSGTGDRVSVSDAVAFTVTVTDVNEKPVITSTDDAFSVLENTTDDVTTVMADDLDVDDDITGYVLDGDDEDRFVITDGGVLRFSLAPNFEDPKDTGGPNRDNVYVVIVRAVGGAGDRAMESDDFTITVTVTNEDEGAEVLGDVEGEVTEAGGRDNNVRGAPQASGRLRVIDPDAGDTHDFVP